MKRQSKIEKIEEKPWYIKYLTLFNMLFLVSFVLAIFGVMLIDLELSTGQIYVDNIKYEQEWCYNQTVNEDCNIHTSNMFMSLYNYHSINALFWFIIFVCPFLLMSLLWFLSTSVPDEEDK